VGANNGTPVSSVTVAGVSATQIAQVNQNNESAGATSALFIALVEGGATGDIVVNWAAGVNDCGIGVLAVTGVNSTPYDTDSDTVDPDTKAIDVPANGLLVGCSCGLASSTPSVAWTNLTERYDATIEASAAHSGAFDTFVSAQTGLTITADWSGGIQVANTMVLASFEEATAPAPSRNGSLMMMGCGC
jgi:hypothetical protein